MQGSDKLMNYSHLMQNFSLHDRFKGDSLKCTKAMDAHLICLERQNSGVEVNHAACPETYQDWENECPVNYRREQMIDRYIEKRNELSTDPRELHNYYRNK